MKLEMGYKSLSLKEIEKYEHFDLICDGDSKKIICIENKEPRKEKKPLLEVLRKEIGENE
jgi:hypothetical protein